MKRWIIKIVNWNFMLILLLSTVLSTITILDAKPHVNALFFGSSAEEIRSQMESAGNISLHTDFEILTNYNPLFSEGGIKSLFVIKYDDIDFSHVKNNIDLSLWTMDTLDETIYTYEPQNNIEISMSLDIERQTLQLITFDFQRSL